MLEFKIIFVTNINYVLFIISIAYKQLLKFRVAIAQLWAEYGEDI